MIQTEFVNGSTHMVAWVPYDKRVKPGSIISFEKSDERWLVTKQYSRNDSTDIKRGWNNNI